MDEQVYVAKKSDPVWLHSRVTPDENEKLHANVYLKIDPINDGCHVVYDERTVIDELTHVWKIFWAKDNDRAQYVPYDWDNPW